MVYNPFNPWQNTFAMQNAPNEVDSLRMHQQRMYEQQQNKLNAMSKAQELGNLVSLRRNSLRLTHDQLADVSGLSPYEIIQIESGNTSSITMEKYLMVLSALRLNLSAYPV